MSFRASAFGLLVLMGALEAHAAATPDLPVPRAEVLADLNPANDDVVAPPEVIADCEAKLRAVGVEFVTADLPVKPGNAKHPTCGAPQAVVYRRGPAHIRYNSAPIL